MCQISGIGRPASPVPRLLTYPPRTTEQAGWLACCLNATSKCEAGCNFISVHSGGKHGLNHESSFRSNSQLHSNTKLQTKNNMQRILAVIWPCVHAHAHVRMGMCIAHMLDPPSNTHIHMFMCTHTFMCTRTHAHPHKSTTCTCLRMARLTAPNAAAPGSCSWLS